MGGLPEGPALTERPPGREKRLIGLSVVLDGRLGLAAITGVAGLVARLGLDGIWWREPPLLAPAAAAVRTAGAASSLRALAAAAGRAPVGVILDLTLPQARVDSWLAAAAAHAARLAVTVGTGRPRASGGEATAVVAASATRDLDAEVAAAAGGLGGIAAGGRPVLAEVPVSIGRTAAEAYARAAGEALFAVTGHPSAQGLFGTLEQCQYRAAALAHAGVTELACHLPVSKDLPDVLAQLRAVGVVGGGVLRPGEPPSPAPPPPAGWGGRPRGR
jgi:hypothetical protein